MSSHFNHLPTLVTHIRKRMIDEKENQLFSPWLEWFIKSFCMYDVLHVWRHGFFSFLQKWPCSNFACGDWRCNLQWKGTQNKNGDCFSELLASCCITEREERLVPERLMWLIVLWKTWGNQFSWIFSISKAIEYWFINHF